jgi:hypothetical protein
VARILAIGAAEVAAWQNESALWTHTTASMLVRSCVTRARRKWRILPLAGTWAGRISPAAGTLV